MLQTENATETANTYYTLAPCNSRRECSNVTIDFLFTIYNKFIKKNPNLNLFVFFSDGANQLFKQYYKLNAVKMLTSLTGIKRDQPRIDFLLLTMLWYLVIVLEEL